MGSAESTPAAEKLAAGPGFWQVVISHFMCAFAAAVFSLLPKYLMTARGLSQAETGPSVMGLPLGALLFSPLLAWAMSRFAKATIVRVCALALAVLTALFALEPDVAYIPSMTLLLGGVGMGVFNSGAGLVAEVAEERAMARALGLHGAAGMLGYAAGPGLLEPLAGRSGWSAAFLLASFSALASLLVPLPVNRSHSPKRFELSLGFARPLGVLMVVSLFAGIMHNALWTSHQPLVLARGGHDVRGYFLGMSFGALGMRVLFAGLPDRLGRARSTLYALTLYLFAALGMTWVTPDTLPLFGLLHGVAHGVFYPSMAALATGRVPAHARGEALIAIYAAFNVGATLASAGFARFGQAYGPAAVYPCAAALGLLGWFTLLHHVRASGAR